MEKIKVKMNYMTLQDYENLTMTRTVEDVLAIVYKVMGQMPKPIRWVAGPLTSGRRTPKENRARLHRTILGYKMSGATTFNYLPFQRRVTQILRREFNSKRLSAAEELLMQERLRDRFYAPIFRSKHISELRVMPNSDASLNVTWMRGFAAARGIPVRYIPKELVPEPEEE